MSLRRHLWNLSYCAVTVSDRSRDQVMAYIEGQKRRKKKVGNFMQIVSSYGVEIKQKNIPLCSTLDIFRKAVSYLIPVYAETWKELFQKSGIYKNALTRPSIWCMRQKRIMPGLRLTVIFLRCHLIWEGRPFNTHLERCPPYQTRLGLWEKGDLKGKPKLVCENHAMPVFYRDVMYKEKRSREKMQPV